MIVLTDIVDTTSSKLCTVAYLNISSERHLLFLISKYRESFRPCTSPFFVCKQHHLLLPILQRTMLGIPMIDVFNCRKRKKVF